MYCFEAPSRVYRTFRELLTGRYKSRELIEFDLFERGKHRHISSVPFRDRIVQKTLCDLSLDPVIAGSFIYDNGASQKNKGYHFHIRRMVRHLQYHYRKHGTDGYILLFDFRKFFENVSHEVIKGILAKKFSDPKLWKLFHEFIDCYGDKGLGLGAQISQTLALLSASPLDHYVKEQLHVKGYGRYMDDGYLIHHSKAYLQKCLKLVCGMCDILHINLNMKKTQIVKLTHGFTFLKCRFFLLETGRVVKKIYKRSVTKVRQKLKKLRKFLDEGRMPYDLVRASIQSWLGYAQHFDAFHTTQNIKRLYNDLFHEEEYLWKIDRYERQQLKKNAA